MLKSILVSGALASSFFLAAAVWGQQAVPFPKDWKEWTHVTSTVVTNEKHPAYGVRQVYVNDKGKAAALSGAKTFPEDTVFILVSYEIKNVEVPGPGGIKSAKLFMGKRKALLLMVKESAKYADTGGWNYASYSLPDGKFIAEAPYKKACFGCHDKRVKAQDFVFTRVPE